MPSRKSPSTLLVADDLDRSTPVARLRSEVVLLHAIRWSELAQATVQVVHVDDPTRYPLGVLGLEPRVGRLDGEAARWVEVAGVQRSIKLTHRLIEGHPVDTLVRLTRAKNRPTLLFLGTSGRERISRWLMGSVSEEVLRHAGCPLVIVGPEAQRGEKSVRATWDLKPRIVVCTQLDQASEGLEATAGQLARQTGGRLGLLFVAPEKRKPPFRDADLQAELDDQDDQLLASFAALLKKRAAKLTRRFKIRCEILPMPRTSRPADAICEEVDRWKATHCALGAQARHGALVPTLGSTLREVILGASVPVIVQPPKSS